MGGIIGGSRGQQGPKAAAWQLLGSCPPWGTTGVPATEAKMQGGERSSRSGNIVLLLRPINPSVRGLSLWGCY